MTAKRAALNFTQLCYGVRAYTGSFAADFVSRCVARWSVLHHLRRKKARMDEEIDRELGKLAKQLLDCAEAAKADDEELLIQRLKRLAEDVLKMHDALKVRRFFEGR